MTSVAPLALLLALIVPAQLYSECKNCSAMSKAERLMFAAHSDACRAESGATPDEAATLLAGRIEDSPMARKHIYCIFRRCKIVGKDGKIRKTAVMDRLIQKANENNASKILDECFEQGGESPEDNAWNLFRCGYDKKRRLFEHMRAALGSPDNV